MLGTALAYIAAAFFICRISLAAAMQAGVPCLSDGAGAACCCALAVWLAKANPSARPTAGNILTTLFIPLLPGICGVTAAQQREFHRRPPERPHSPNS